MRRKIIFILLVLILLPNAIMPFVRFVKCAAYPYQLDNVEGFVLNQSVTLGHWKSIYKSIDAPPYLVGTYGPVYPWMNAMLFNENNPGFLGGRGLSIAALIGIGVVGILFIRRYTGSVLPGLLFCVLYLSTFEVYRWCPYYRVDFVAIFWSFLGLYYFSRIVWDKENPDNFRFRSLSILFFVLGVFTKQTMIAAPLASIICVFVKNREKKAVALRYTITLLAWILSIFALLCLITKGQYFLHTIYYNTNEFSFELLIRTTKNLLWKFNKAIFALMIVYIAFDVKNLRLYTFYAYLSLLTIVTMGKTGAAENYMLEPLLGMYVFICITFYSYMDKASSMHFGNIFRQNKAACVEGEDAGEGEKEETKELAPHRYRIFSLVLVSILLLYGHVLNNYVFRTRPEFFWGREFSANGIFGRPFIWARNPTDYERSVGKRVVAEINKQSKKILCEDPIFLMLCDREVLFQPFIMSALAKEGKWNEVPLVSTIKLKQYGLIVTTRNLLNTGEYFERYTTNFVNAIREYYTLSKVIGEKPTSIKYFAFVPKEPPKTPKPEVRKPTRSEPRSQGRL